MIFRVHTKATVKIVPLFEVIILYRDILRRLKRMSSDLFLIFVINISDFLCSSSKSHSEIFMLYSRFGFYPSHKIIIVFDTKKYYAFEYRMYFNGFALLCLANPQVAKG